MIKPDTMETGSHSMSVVNEERLSDKTSELWIDHNSIGFVPIFSHFYFVGVRQTAFSQHGPTNHKWCSVRWFSRIVLLTIAQYLTPHPLNGDPTPGLRIPSSVLEMSHKGLTLEFPHV